MPRLQSLLKEDLQNNEIKDLFLGGVDMCSTKSSPPLRPFLNPDDLPESWSCIRQPEEENETLFIFNKLVGWKKINS